MTKNINKILKAGLSFLLILTLLLAYAPITQVHVLATYDLDDITEDITDSLPQESEGREGEGEGEGEEPGDGEQGEQPDGEQPRAGEEEPEPDPEPEPGQIEDAEDEATLTALLDNDVTEIINITADITLTGTIEINDKTLIIADGVTLTNSATIINNGIIYIEGALAESTGIITNNGQIEVSADGVFELPSELNNDTGVIYGELLTNFEGNFSLLTFDANGGTLHGKWPSIVMAEPDGSMFDLTKLNVQLDPPSAETFGGWLTDLQQGEIIDQSEPFDGAGETIYALWMDATTAAELMTFLQAAGNGVFTLKAVAGITYDIVLSEDIILGGNKVIIAGAAGSPAARIYANNISGNYILTMQHADVSVSGEIDCDITLITTKLYIRDISFFEHNNPSVLKADRTIKVNSGELNINKPFINDGLIFVYENGFIDLPTAASLTNNSVILGITSASFRSGFGILTFNANGGTILGLPSILTAEPTGATFNLTKFFKVEGSLSAPQDKGLSGWYTAATGGTKVSMTNTAYSGAGRTLFAQWVNVTTAAELIAFLTSSGNNTFTLITLPDWRYTVYIEQNITLGGNKTIEAAVVLSGGANVEIYGNLTPNGNRTLTMKNADLTVNGNIDCNITLQDWANLTIGSFNNRGNSVFALESGRTINTNNGSIMVNNTFENKGTINANILHIFEDRIFVNHGTLNTVNYERYSTQESKMLSYYGTMYIGGRFTNGGGTVNNNGTISVYGKGFFERPTLIRNNNGVIYGESTSNFSGSSSFDFLTLHANGGLINNRSTMVVAEPIRSYNMTKVFRDIQIEIPYRHLFEGWFNAATGGTKANMSNTAATTRNLYIQWEDLARGATVSGPPTVATAQGSVTQTKITVNAVTLPVNPGGQTVEYAITSSSSSTMPTGLTWQSGTVFTGLTADTAYRVWARSALNEEKNAGAAVRSASIRTLAKLKGVAISSVPTVLNTTINSITVNAIPIIDSNPSGQVVEYAISTTTTTPTKGWQKETTFTGLTHAKTYYVFARSAANAYNNAGAVRRSAAIDTLKLDGGAVSGAPVVSGEPTHSSITVLAVTNAGGTGQALRYAISTNPDALPEDLTWQSGRTFNNLVHKTIYYVFARTAENSNYYAGIMQRSAAIETAVGTFAITLSKTGIYTYPSATFGYGARTAETITVRNVGNQSTTVGSSSGLSVTLDGADASKFEIVKALPANIAAGKNSNFTIRPVTGLIAGTYSVKVIVSGIGEHVGPYSSEFLLVFTVNKRAGAALRADPAVNTASRTPTTLTVSNVPNIAPNSNPGAQTIQYAITTSTSASMPSTLVWKNYAEGETVSFEGLRPSTRYFIWARTAANENCNAGTARRSAEIRTQAPVQAISLNRNGTQTITAAQLGYNNPGSLSVSVNSVGTGASGNLKIELSGFYASSFELSKETIPSVAKGRNDTFTVRPVTGLVAGTYTATVTVSGTDGSEAAQQSFIVSFTVNKLKGTALSSTEIPIVASKDKYSITVTAPVLSPSGTGQVLQYAITTSTSSTAPTGGWQDSPVFGGLDPATNYRVWARFAQNDSYSAGTARRSVVIRTEAEDYQVTINRAGHTFASSKTFGAARPGALTVTVNNMGKLPSGDLTVALTGDGAQHFELGGNALSAENKLLSIAGDFEGKGGSRTFTVRPKANVPVSSEPYTATVTVSGGVGPHAFEIDFDVSFSVIGTGTGAKLSAAPRATRTDTSVTVTNQNSLIAHSHPGGQDTVLYAITTSSSDKMPSGLVWRQFAGGEEIIFENLRSNTTYYVWARLAANENCNAGAARRSSGIKTQTPAHGVVLNRAGTNILSSGWNTNPPSLSVTATSRNRVSGVLTVELDGVNPEAFELRGSAQGGTLNSISKGGTRNFNVRPVSDLGIGEYNATVIVSGVNRDTSAPFTVSFDIIYTVGLGKGAAVNSVPFAKEVTADSIEAVPVRITGINPGGQDVEYTISTSSATTAAAIAALDKQDKWQKTLVFTGLEPSTTYYVFARSAESDYCSAGAVRRSAAIRTDMADYCFTLSRRDIQTFTTATQGYTVPPVLTVIVNNTGKLPTGVLTAELDTTGDDFFEILPFEFKADIPAHASRIFTVRPKQGLPAGSYSGTVTVSNEDMSIVRSFDVKFTVSLISAPALSPIKQQILMPE